jgi:phosphonate transport system substrate-binding protein
MRRRTLVPLFVALMLVLGACASTGSDDTTTTTAGGSEETTTTAGGSDETTTTAAETTTTEADPTADWPETIVYGFIPSEQAETLGDAIQPYMDFLSAELGIEVEGVVTPDYNGLVVAMGAGQADLGAFGPFGYVQAQAQYPTLEVLMQSIRFGSATSHGQWFTNDPSICDEEPVEGALENGPDGVVLVEPFDAVALQVGVAFDDDGAKVQETLEDGTPVDFGLACIASLDKVEGKDVAFTSATSTSGAVFPQLQLINLGLDIENDISYSYLGSHTDTVAAVYNDDFDIGLSFDDARRNIREDSPDVGSKVIVFNITDEIPNDVVVARGELPDSLKQAVYDATVAFLSTDEGVALFDEIYGWTDIQPAEDEAFDVVRAAAEQFGITED